MIALLVSNCDCHALQVSHFSLFSLEAERDVCYMHVDCPIASGSQQSRFSVCLYPGILLGSSGK